MGICSTCKYWGNNRNYNKDYGERLKSCDNPKFIYDYDAFCQNDEDEPSPVPDDGAVIEDDSGWGMLTGSQFGCVNWEEIIEEDF